MAGKMRRRLWEAKKEMASPVRDRKVDAGKYSYSYADLGQYHDIIEPPLWSHGLDFEQCVCRYDKDDFTLQLWLLDMEGDEKPILIDERTWVHRMDSQALGSAETYALRYQLRTAFGLPAEDDDGRKSKEYADTDPFEAKVEETAQRMGVSHDEVMAALKRANCRSKGEGIRYMDTVIKAGTFNVKIEES